MCLQILDQLWAKVVTIIVSHELSKLIVNLFDDFINEITIRRFLKMVLQKLRTNFFSG